RRIRTDDMRWLLMRRTREELRRIASRSSPRWDQPAWKPKEEGSGANGTHLGSHGRSLDGGRRDFIMATWTARAALATRPSRPAWGLPCLYQPADSWRLAAPGTAGLRRTS